MSLLNAGRQIFSVHAPRRRRRTDCEMERNTKHFACYVATARIWHSTLFLMDFYFRLVHARRHTRNLKRSSFRTKAQKKKSHKRSNFRDFLLPRDEKSIKYRKHVYRFEKFERSFAFITNHLQMREPLADNAGEGIYESSRLKSRCRDLLAFNSPARKLF